MTWIAVVFLDDRTISGVSPVFESKGAAEEWTRHADEATAGNVYFRVFASRELWDCDLWGDSRAHGPDRAEEE